MRLALLLALSAALAGCAAPADEEGVAPSPAPPADAPAPGAAATGGEPPLEPAADAPPGRETVTLTATVRLQASAGVAGTPVAGAAENAALAAPRAGAAQAVLTATWEAGNPTTAELVVARVQEGRLVPVGRGTSPLVLDVVDLFSATDEHVLTAHPATGAAHDEAVALELVLTYG